MNLKKKILYTIQEGIFVNRYTDLSIYSKALQIDQIVIPRHTKSIKVVRPKPHFSY